MPFLALYWVVALMEWLLWLIRASVCLGVHRFSRASKSNEFESVKQPSVVGTSEAVPVNPQRRTKFALSPMCVEHE